MTDLAELVAPLSAAAEGAIGYRVAYRLEGGRQEMVKPADLYVFSYAPDDYWWDIRLGDLLDAKGSDGQAGL